MLSSHNFKYNISMINCLISLIICCTDVQFQYQIPMYSEYGLYMVILGQLEVNLIK